MQEAYSLRVLRVKKDLHKQKWQSCLGSAMLQSNIRPVSAMIY
jgi:hypothetical protein